MDSGCCTYFPKSLLESNKYRGVIFLIFVLKENGSSKVTIERIRRSPAITVEMILIFLKSVLFSNIGGIKYKITSPLNAKISERPTTKVW